MEADVLHLKSLGTGLIPADVYTLDDVATICY